MIKFNQFLKEQEETEGKKLKHLTHVEDHIIHNGHEGAAIAADHLENVHSKLLGKNNSINVSTKFDGAPSIVYGTHPETGQFFVASKSAFNKNPKLNFTPEDVDRNHGHAPGLVEKLKAALQHLPKTMPKNGGIFQGDLMYTKPDVSKTKNQYSFTPNTITYNMDANSAHGKAIKNSELGIVTHTKYGGGRTLDSMSAMPLDKKTRESFIKHPDVNSIDPTIDVNPSNYTHEEQKAFLGHMENARKAYGKMAPESMDALSGHGIQLEAHINDMVRKGGTPSVQGYMDHLTARSKKEIDKLKSPAGKDRKIQEHAAIMKHIMDNKEHFEKALEMHSHLQKAKNVLVGVMAKNNSFGHTIAGEATGPEGAVAVDKQGNMTKFVDRNEFSRQNLLGAGKFQKNVQEEYLFEEAGETHVMTYMRANPPTAGHEKVVNRLLDIAKKTGGTHTVILSHSQDAEKNPLSPSQKLKHARNAFPNANVVTSSKENPSLINHAVGAYNNGVRHLHVVVGQDRVEQFRDVLNKYNGVSAKHGMYNFKSITVHSAGDRDPDAEGTEGISATKMRKAAVSGDRDTFHSGSSSAMSEKHRDEMMHDVRNAMSVKEETGKVPVSFVDHPSVAELSARGAAMESSKKKNKKLKENTTTAMAGGLGFNSGNPAAQDNHVGNYVDRNTADADTIDNMLKNMMAKSKHNINQKIGFKNFDPHAHKKAKTN